MSGVINVNSYEQLDRLCEEIARLSPIHLPLARAAASGATCVARIEGHSTPWPAKHLSKYGHRPICVVIADDHGHGFQSYAPTRWKCAERLRRWCAGVLVHGSGGERWHYEQAVLGTLAVKRFALIETTSEHALAWAKFFAPKPTLLIIPQEGVHPIQPVMH